MMRGFVDRIRSQPLVALVVVLAAAAAVTATVVLTGGEDKPVKRAADAEQARLKVVVYPDGRDGNARDAVELACDFSRPRVKPASLCDKLRALEPADFAAVKPDSVCTTQIAGPQEATVTGRLRGQRIDATFNLRNGCEISRWQKLDLILGSTPQDAAPKWQPPKPGEQAKTPPPGVPETMLPKPSTGGQVTPQP